MSDTNVHRVVGNLLVGTSHFFVDTTTNRVGVNTSSPSASLDIATGDLKVGSGITLASGGTITATAFDGDGSLLQNINSDSGSWVNGTNSNVHLAVSTDKVGVGTTTPEVPFSVVGNNALSGNPNNAIASFRATTTIPGTNDAGVVIGSINGNAPYIADVSTASLGLSFYTQNVERMKINSSGNVGIGTSPDTKLHLYATGSGNVLDFKMSGSWSSGDYYRIIGFNEDKQIQFNYNDGMWLSDNNSIRFGCGGTQGTSGLYTEQLRIRSDGIYPTTIGRLSHSSGYLVGSYNNVGNNSTKVNPIYVIGSNYKPGSDDSMTGPTGAGNMYGIGYSHGNFNSILTSGWGLYVAANGSATIGLNADDGQIKCTGYVMAAHDTNTASYFGRAAIGYCGHNNYMSVSHVDSNSTSGYALLQSASGFTFLNCESGQGIAFRIANGDYMRMDSSGKFGIGTTNPSEKLHVNGEIIRLQRSNGDAYLRNDATWWRNYSGNGAGIHLTGGAVMPTDSNGNWPSTPSLGHPTYKWGQIYSTSSSISTSDRTTKQDINEMTESEKKVAAKMVNLFRTYRVKDAVEEKGEKARVHSGVVAQDLIEAFQSEGLDAHRYGLFCYDDVWMVDGKNELFETVYMKNGDRNFVDENGVQREYTADDEGVEEVKEGTGIFADKDTPGAVATPGLYSIRYEELLCFVVGGVLKDFQTTEAELKIAKADIETTKADIETTKADLETTKAVNQKLEARLAFLESALIS